MTEREPVPVLPSESLAYAVERRHPPLRLLASIGIVFGACMAVAYSVPIYQFVAGDARTGMITLGIRDVSLIFPALFVAFVGSAKGIVLVIAAFVIGCNPRRTSLALIAYLTVEGVFAIACLIRASMAVQTATSINPGEVMREIASPMTSLFLIALVLWAINRVDLVSGNPRSQ